jgi:hypothetical protein
MEQQIQSLATDYQSRNRSRMLPADAHELLSSWFASKMVPDISFRESFPTTHDPSDDYKVVYEAIFEPQTLDKARVEIWVTDEGNIAFGFETRQRIATRLSVAYWRKRKRFAAGHEPISLSRDGVLALLGTISNGKLLLNARTFFGVLDGTQAAMWENDRQDLESAGYDYFGWIGVVRERILPFNFGISGTLIRFRPWQ